MISQGAVLILHINIFSKGQKNDRVNPDRDRSINVNHMALGVGKCALHSRSALILTQLKLYLHVCGFLSLFSL